MQMLRSKAKLTATIVLVLLMASVMLMANVPNVSVQAAEVSTSGPPPAGVTPTVTVPTVAYLSFRPNPVGLGQPILVNLWVTPGMSSGRVMRGYKVTITNPNGTQTVLPFDSEPATGAIWFEWTMDQVGTWKLKFDFAGCYFNGSTTQATQSAYYLPSSTAEQTVTVQTDMVASWPPAPLPTDYWTRPVPYEHREWWTILGNYPWTGPGGGTVWDELYPNTNPWYSSSYRFIPWTQAPNTCHIVWTRQDYASAGIIGAGLQGITTSAGALTASPQYGYWNYPGYPSICFQGRAYETVTKVRSVLINGTYYDQPRSVWECYDVRTGQVYWDQTGVTAPTVIEYSESTSTGGIGDASRPLDALLLAITGNLGNTTHPNYRLIKYNPDTGAVATNVSIPVTGTYYKNGYCLAVQNIGNTTNPNYRLINWTTFGTSTNFASRIASNTTYARSSLPTLIDWNVGLGATVSGNTTAGVYIGINVQGFRLSTGESLWNATVAEPLYSGSCTIADHGKVAALSINGYFMAWDLVSGNLAWKSEKMVYPWDSTGFGWYGVVSAYGMLFRNAYGYIYAFDWETGKIVWKHATPAATPYEAPYIDANGNTVYAHNQDGVAVDGKYYVWSNEHSATNPITRGWGLDCINITTGERIWYKIGAGTTPIVVHDGYLFLPNQGTGRMEVLGKGKSATTVTASPKTIANGATVLIEGTVLDQSPAQPGTPCVSAASMEIQMEYLHNQMPIGGLWGNETITGVPVNLLAMGSDGTTTDLGTVTSNGYYGTFSTAWTPSKEDTYTIIATFGPDDSYGSSSASTAVTVGPAPATPTPTPEPPQAESDNTPLYILGATIAMIIAVVIATILLLRKRP